MLFSAHESSSNNSHLNNVACSCSAHLDSSICIRLSARASALSLHAFHHFGSPGFLGSDLLLGHWCTVHVPLRPFNGNIRGTNLLNVAASLAANTDTCNVDQVTGGCITLATHNRTGYYSECSSCSSRGTQKVSSGKTFRILFVKIFFAHFIISGFRL